MSRGCTLGHAQTFRETRVFVQKQLRYQANISVCTAGSACTETGAALASLLNGGTWLGTLAIRPSIRASGTV